MDEQKEMPEELDSNPGGPPDLPEETNIASEPKADVQMPEMSFAQESSAATPQTESPDMNETDAEALMLKMMEESATENQAAGISSNAPQQVVERAAFDQLRADGRAETKNIDMLLDVTLPISIELGRTALKIEDILNLGPGSVVELDKLAGEPVDLLVNDKLMARGEVVVVDENFGVRITTMVSPQDRIRSLK